MFLLLLVFLMRFVDISILNRPRTRCGGSTSSPNNSLSSCSSNSNSSSKENYNGQHHQQATLTPQQYQQLRYYQRLQQQQLQLLHRQLLQRRNSQQQNQNGRTPKGMLSERLDNCSRVDGSNFAQSKKGPKLQRGMTEFSSQNESHKSHLPQLNRNSPRHQPSKNTPAPNHQKPQHHHYKRPLTSPNVPPFNATNYGYGFPSYNSAAAANQQHPHHQPAFNTSSTTSYFNPVPYVSDLLNDDELTDESLKKNVQIVLNNLDRYNHALRSIILNEQVNSISHNNNSNMAGNNLVQTPESDYNSNATNLHHPFAMGFGSLGGGHLACSIASSHDFTHDNSDYQWFLDYGYRDEVAHQSVLSSLCESYNGIGELSYYEDLAMNIDANLAEVDMESFRAEDIHSLLTQIPSFCKEKHTTEIDNSICKSELLFSPVKESHISIDSLDLNEYPEDDDIILTCKANKDNYTIAFEGSALYSDESFYAEPADINTRNKQNFINLHSNLDDIVKRKSLEVSMSRSDNAFTTWSKLKKSSTTQLQRYPSGNNNTSVNTSTRHAPHCNVRKSSSLPNLRLKKDTNHQLNVSQALSTSTVDSYKLRNLLPMCHMPISSNSGCESPVHHAANHSNTSTTSSHNSSSQMQTDSSSPQQTQQEQQPQPNNPNASHQPAFNLVKLFIKQKSSSSETCMDVSSGCWPSSDASSSLERDRLRKKSMNDSGKGSQLSRHEEENDDDDKADDDDAADSSYQLDSLDICDRTNNSSRDATPTATAHNTPKRSKPTDLYREVFESSSPAHRLKPLKNPQVLNLTTHNNNLNNNNNNNNNSIEKSLVSSGGSHSRTSENVTQVSAQSRMKIPVDQITRSMQTSALMKDRLKFVPPSFLAKLNKLGEEKRAPVYVIYPNYALPDLGFVKTNQSPEVIFSPFNYKTVVGSSGLGGAGIKKRPTSFTSQEEAALKNVEYKNVADWKSLVTLLPIEYRKRLKHIPEADIATDPDCSMKPLFCMTPPLRRHGKPTICDCAQYYQQTPTCTSGSGSSGSSQPPSSGYRGSSTLLTDSEFDSPQSQPSDPMRNMYVYQYENADQQSPRTPRGILRKHSSRPLGRGVPKRNSMYEDENNSNMKNLEKRRSLQEPYYMSEEHILVEEDCEEDEKMRQYYDELHTTFKQDQAQERKSRKDRDLEARARAENFLSNVPKSELKYYAEIASILESTDSACLQYDSAKLKNEVSRALSQKKVSFHQTPDHHNTLHVGVNGQRFSTPPNSPNISMAGLRVNHAGVPLRPSKEQAQLSAVEQEKLDKISTNRFKRLQIQWELLSKDSSMMLKDLASENETKSGGSTPTSANGHRSRIPRPVSYPASRNRKPPVVENKNIGKDAAKQIPSDLRAPNQDPRKIQSPSRLVPPKRYSVPTPSPAISTAPAPPPASSSANSSGSGTATTVRSRTPTSRTNATNSNSNTPKRRISQSPRTATRTR